MDGIKLFSKKRKRDAAVKRAQAITQPIGEDNVAEQPVKLQKLTAARPDGRPRDRPDPEASDLRNFRDLGVSEWLELVCNSLGMKQPTQVGLWLTDHAADLLQPGCSRGAATSHRRCQPGCSCSCGLWTCSVPCSCSRLAGCGCLRPLQHPVIP